LDKTIAKKIKLGFYAITLTIFLTGIFFVASCSPSPVQEGVLDPSDHLQKESPSNLFPVEVEDYLNKKITINTPPETIISLVPAHTEILFALGLGENLIGVTDYCDYPPEALDIEKIGGFSDPSLEKIISLNPDLVIGNILNFGTLEALNQAGIPALAFEPHSFAQIFADIKTIGAVTGKSKEAEELSAAIKKDYEEIKAKIATIPVEERPSVFFEIWHDPLTTVGPDTFLYEILEIAAGKVVSSPGGDRYPLFSLEKLIEEDPDFYFATAGSMSDFTDLQKRPGWEVLSAVKNNKVHIISDENIIYRGGPRIIEGLKEITGVLYPDLFGKE
jgi:iron complex transport system substrate-binding protein